MLHFEAVPRDTLDLLIRLCQKDSLTKFALVGGTSLALRFGHRLSVDLDFFTPESFSGEALLEELRGNFEVSHSTMHGGGMGLFIEGVKVDVVTYRYPLMAPFEEVDGIRLYSLPDVIGMKLSALSNRGAKKDFFDVAELVNQFGLGELLKIYRTKYPDQEPVILLRSLVYFDDAELEPDPVSLTGVTWEEVKAGIVAAVRVML
jgi:predicted nucleotidyltransferase component of viral defense system